jgi:hypothetical protein
MSFKFKSYFNWIFEDLLGDLRVVIIANSSYLYKVIIAEFYVWTKSILFINSQYAIRVFKSKTSVLLKVLLVNWYKISFPSVP